MFTTTQPFDFAPATPRANAHAPTFLSWCLGAVIGCVVMFGVLLSGFMMVQEDAGGLWYVVGVSLMLVVAAVKNWRLQWNALGRVMRYLIGEGATRVYFAITGLLFACGGMLALVAAQLPVP